ncbi:YhdT family protein [Enterovibrio sp. ZSDZ35]|uniref:YhdT family protein n=1 Tax=Enterovibrio qingdaonensis TaxID=2899818 RepID=A0ABT5QS77_9GAMM|nr:YhdT family protein [Enterovibrio sp. ZSDZ35]MDD1783835.1 YhdT family protein [Enterovibrio sp. ZSDZ35]
MKTLSSRYRQAHKEAKWAIALALAYFLWWYGFAYGLAPEGIEQAMPELYFGLPLWFLLACVVGPILFTVLCALMVKFLFKDMSLDIEQDTENE